MAILPHVQVASRLSGKVKVHLYSSAPYSIVKSNLSSDGESQCGNRGVLVNSFRQRMCHFLYETYTRARIAQLFNIIIEFPADFNPSPRGCRNLDGKYNSAASESVTVFPDENVSRP